MESNALAEEGLRWSKIPLGEQRVIYVAGPYRAKTPGGQVENIWHATRVAVRLWELGWIVFSPMNNTANFNWYSHLPDEVWLRGGLKFLELCQAIIMLKGFGESVGAKRELEVALELGLEVYYE